MAAPVSTPGLAVPGLAVPGGYSAAAAAPVNAFEIAFITGDSTSATQAFAPAGWTTLPTVTASNGTDHSCDVVLTAAWTVTSGAESVSGTAGTAEDLSGSILGVQVDAPSPIPAGANPAWPGRTIAEAGFGSGFETPPDEIVWASLNDSGAPAGTVKRFWGFSDQSGVPYALGQLQSSSGTMQYDNFDSALSPGNTAGEYWPDVQTGTPLRVRFALGTMAGVDYNRWYVFSRNALEWPEKRNDAMRNYVDTATTDIWSVVAGSCPSAYRGEILQEASLYSWYTMDDQPLSGGVQPTSLVNSAPGNTTVLSVLASPGGVTAGDAYTTTGVDATAGGSPPIPPSVATYTAGADQGWMYGDPQSSPSSYATGNPVTSSPGSAAWQQSGLLGSGGSNGWFLAVNDPGLPALAGGVTVKGWFNAAFFGTASGYVAPSLSRYDLAGQPYSVITLATLSTGTAPVAILQLDLSGHLQLITYAGTTPTPHAIYTASDLRSNSWHCIDLQLTQTTWSVMVDGGLNASASGTVSAMTSSWSWLTFNGDYGNTHGGTTPAQLQHGGNVAYGHWAVFASELPAWRLLSHYSAAITGFGLLPAPQSVTVSEVINEFSGSGYTPDGSLFNGSYGYSGGGGGTVVPYSASAVAVSQAGSYTSGPSARAIIAGVGADTGGVFYGNALWSSWAGLAPQFTLYTSAAAAAETSAATVNGSGDSFSSGYGAGAVDAGVCSTGGGTGASPPAAPSALGDAVGQRLERILGYGRITYPNRAIDPAPLPVSAALDIGGQQTGASCSNIVQSDNGWLYVDQCGTLSYRDKAHLASDQVVWYLSSAGPQYGIPYQPDQEFDTDPQKVVNIVQISQYAPDGASLPLITPSSATAVNASQAQYGPRPLQSNTSYLQDAGKIQEQADWLIDQYGVAHRRVAQLTVNASAYLPAWPFWLSANPADLCQVVDLPLLGGPVSVGTYRISSVARRLFYGANKSTVTAEIKIVAEFEPSAYWS